MLTRTRARKSFWKWRNFKKFFLLFQLLLPTALRPIVLHLPKLHLYRLPIVMDNSAERSAESPLVRLHIGRLKTVPARHPG